MPRHFALLLILLAGSAFPGTLLALQDHAPSSEQVRVNPPGLRHAEPPPANATAQELEDRAEQLRFEKNYADAIDYYQAAINKNRGNASLYNRKGFAEIMIQRYGDARKSLEHALKLDHDFVDAHINLGVVRYADKKYSKAIAEYEKAIQLRPDCATCYNNLGAAYWAKKEYEPASLAYARALQLDPDIFIRTSRTGFTGQLPSPQDRARFDYVIAKLYAKQGDSDRSLQYLRRCIEEGYKGIKEVYKDPEFSSLRSDPRFTQLMANQPTPIPE